MGDSASKTFARGARTLGRKFGETYESASAVLSGAQEAVQEGTANLLSGVAQPTAERKAQLLEKERQRMQEGEDTDYQRSQSVLGIFGQDAKTQDELDAEDFVQKNIKKKEETKTKPQRKYIPILGARG